MFALWIHIDTMHTVRYYPLQRIKTDWIFHCADIAFWPRPGLIFWTVLKPFHTVLKPCSFWIWMRAFSGSLGSSSGLHIWYFKLWIFYGSAPDTLTPIWSVSPHLQLLIWRISFGFELYLHPIQPLDPVTCTCKNIYQSASYLTEKYIKTKYQGQ